MTTTTTRPYSIQLPEGIIPLEVAETASGAQALEATPTSRFGLPAGDTSAAVLAETFTGFGQLLGESGMEFAGIGLFRSPDEPDRPTSVLLTGTRLPSDHDSPDVAITGLRDLHSQHGDATVETVTLPCGPAVVVIDENLQALPAGMGADPVVL